MRFDVSMLRGLAFIVLVISAAWAQPASGERLAVDTPKAEAAVERQDSEPLFPPRRFGRVLFDEPAVRRVLISPDGETVVAEYFRPGINRIGSDWLAAVVVYDLEAGKRTVLRDAVSPVAFVEGGQRLLMGRRTIQDRRGGEVEWAVWPVGGEEIERLVDGPIADAFMGNTRVEHLHYELDEDGKVDQVSMGLPGEDEPVRSNVTAYTEEEQNKLWPQRFVASARAGDRLVVADRRGVVTVWDTHRWRRLNTLVPTGQAKPTVRVAAIQSPSVFGDPKANRRKLLSQARYAAEGGAQIIVLPEAAITGYLSTDLKQTWQADNRPLGEGLRGVDPSDAAESADGDSVKRFAALAKGMGVYISVPFVEVDAKTGKFYNTVVLVGPDGEPTIHYRKRNPWPWADQSWVTPGDLGTPIIDTIYGKLGVAVCYDIHKQAAVLAKKDIDILLYSIAWVEDEGSDWFDKRLPAIAKRHGYHIIAANWALPEDAPEVTWFGHGQSRIIHADGRVLAKATDEQGTQTVFADLPIPDAMD